MARFCFYAHVLYFDFFGCAPTSPVCSRAKPLEIRDGGSFVSLRRQWCCGGDTLGRIAQLERRLLSKAVSFSNSIIYSNLTNNKDDSVIWHSSWHVFRFCSRWGLSRASNHQQYLKHGSNRTAGCCCHCCCVAFQPATKRMADRAKEESKMKLRIVSKPFDGYMSPAALTNNKDGPMRRYSASCCCCSTCSETTGD